jgi:hypothetical protein
MVTDVKLYGNTRGLRTDRAVTVTRDTVTEHWHTTRMPVLSHGGLAGGPPGPDRDTLITGMTTVTGLCRRDCQAGTAKDSDDDHRVLSMTVTRILVNHQCRRWRLWAESVDFVTA